ncbi:uncharacterized protein LOC111078081 [Drosophila obscura]|uniref:uncharacterized protein LOC111078081 n=1 Tax=Drosophila obscura TaxID=7282 RepID=UPI001BB2C269|nr:uncharacterized protein LOC111078081 [Drosophila obscura]
MPLPKYSGKHIVGDDSSDESSSVSSPTGSLEDNGAVSDASSNDSSSDESSSEGSTDSESTSSEESPSVIEYEMPNVEPPEEDAPIMVLNPFFQMQGAAMNGETAGPILPQSGPFVEGDPPGCSNTDNIEAVPDRQTDNIEADMQMQAYTQTDNIEVVPNTQTISTQVSETDFENDLPPIRRRRAIPASFEDPESIGARVSKRGRGSTASGEFMERAKPLQVTNYFQGVSARLVRERVGLLPFREFCHMADRGLEKAVARSKQGQAEGPK